MVGKIFKIAAFALFGIAFALACGAIVGINADSNSEVGGWLMFAAGITVIVAGVCATIAIFWGKGSTAEKTGKIFLLSTPFLLCIVALGAIVFIGGALLVLWIYMAGSMFM